MGNVPKSILPLLLRQPTSQFLKYDEKEELLDENDLNRNATDLLTSFARNVKEELIILHYKFLVQEQLYLLEFKIIWLWLLFWVL